MYAKSIRPSAKRDDQIAALGALKLTSEARDESVPAQRADFFLLRENLILFYKD